MAFAYLVGSPRKPQRWGLGRNLITGLTLLTITSGCAHIEDWKLNYNVYPETCDKMTWKADDEADSWVIHVKCRLP